MIRRRIIVTLAGAIVAVVAICGQSQTNDDYYAPAPTKYGSGTGRYPPGDKRGERMKARAQYARFNLLNQLHFAEEILWNNTNSLTFYRQLNQDVENLHSAGVVQDIHWSNQLRRAEFKLLQAERDLAHNEETLYKIYAEYKKPNPLSFIPNEEVRQEFLSQTNKITKEEWKQLERLGAEKEKREKLLQLDLGKMDCEISEAEIKAATGQTAPPPEAVEFKLPRPD